MPRRPDTHPRTRAVLRALAADPARWWHGYELARLVQVSSGTLYPLLARLAERGYLTSTWEEEPPRGRPRRHLYQVTPAGVAHDAQLAADDRASSPAPRVRPRVVGA